MTDPEPPSGKSAGTRRAPLIAALVYWAVIFATGFILATVRVLALEPVLGAVSAVALEVPVMVAVSWIASRTICRRLEVPARSAPRILMGGVAFTLLMIAEVALSVYGFGQPVEAWIGSFGTPDGFLGLAGQLAFAAIPAIQAAFRPAT